MIAAGAIFCGNLFAQTVLTPHFTDESKKIVIPKDAAVFPEIREGMIVVSRYPTLLYLNTKGEYIFGTDFAFTRGHDSKTAYFSGGAMMGWRTKPNGFAPSPFIVYPDGKYRDLAADISNASSFLDGYALVHKGQSVIMGVKQTFIDKNGKEVFPALTSTQRGTMGDMTIYPLREKRRLYYNADLKKYGYADDKGVIAVKPQFDKGENFSEGLAAVMVNNKWGFIDPTGKMTIPATYNMKPGRFREGLAAVRIGDSEYNYEMAYIDKAGKRVMDNKRWSVNEFSNGLAWVGTGCEKLFVMNREFEEVRDLTQSFYYEGNGFGVCNFSMLSGDVQNRSWGFDFPNGRQVLSQAGLDAAGEIFAPDGSLLFTARDAKGNRVGLHPITEGDLMLVKVRFENEPRLKESNVYMSCFINQKGEVVYYFEEGVEGYEGRTPTQLK